MRDFIIRILINAIAIAVTAILVPGIQVSNDGLMTFLIIGLVFSVINALVKPVLILLTCPAVILTLGLFIFVINAVILNLTAQFSGGRLFVEGFGAAFIGGIIMALVNMVLEGVFGVHEEDKYDSSKSYDD